METFSTLLALYGVNSPLTGEFALQKPVTGSFDAFFDLRLNKRLSKQSIRQWIETQSRPLWRHGNVLAVSSDSFTLLLQGCFIGDRYILGGF